MQTLEYRAPNQLELSATQATELAWHADEYGYRYDRPAHLFENGWRYLEAAQWLVEYSLRGEHSLLDEQLPGALYDKGIAEIRRSVEKSDDQQFYHKYINVLMANRAIRWFCEERMGNDTDFETMANMLLQDTHHSLHARYDRSMRELADQKTTAKRRDVIRGDFGYLAEAMVMGLVAEGETFRNARVIGLPASPSAENKTEQNKFPADIMLWHVNEDKTTYPIGGIQVKSKKRTGLDPSNFTSVFNLRTRGSGILTTETNAEIIKRWLEGVEGLEEIHSRLGEAVLRSDNEALIKLLNL